MPAHWLAYTKWKGKAIIEAIINMPLVFATFGAWFYLLLAFSPSHAFGNLLDKYFDVRLVFSFAGLVISSVVIYSFAVYGLSFTIGGFQRFRQL